LSPAWCYEIRLVRQPRQEPPKKATICVFLVVIIRRFVTMSDYDDNDDDDDHHRAIDSDEDEEPRFVSAKKRFKYTTFENDDKDDQDDDDDDDDHDGKDRALYGSFLGEKRKNPRGGIKMNTTPMFVKQTFTKQAEEAPPKAKEPTENSTSEPSEEQKESDKLNEALQKQQDDANARFLALLGRGKGDSRAKRALEHDNVHDMTRFTAAPKEETEEFFTEPPSFAGVGAGGLGFSGGGIGFGGSSEPIKKDPNLGKWEKHTKGIGMKLLAKMGYKGSGGLGAKRAKKTVDGTSIESKGGISKSIEVVVRPNNLGLGFGNFKEATKLKVNQQIEAEIRGIELPKEEKPKEEVSTRNRSALPSTKDIMQQQSWKRGQGSLKRPLKIVSYTEILETRQQPTIIDMRGPAATADSASDGKNQAVPLAEELLHNVSILLNTYENKLHSSAHFAQSTKRKWDSLQSDLNEMERRKKNAQDRIAKMEGVIRIMSSIEETLKMADSQDIVVNKVQAQVQEMASTLSPEDKTALKFDEVLVPSLLSPLVQAQLDQWKPLWDDATTTERIVGSILQLGAGVGDNDLAAERQRSIFTRQVLPKVKAAFESTKWNPIDDAEKGVVLYEAVFKTLHAVTPTKPVGLEDDANGVFPSALVDEGVSLTSIAKAVIIRETVVPKMLRTIAQWKPELDTSKTQLLDRLDLWILPWLPHFDYASTLQELSNELRRKVRSALSYLKGKNMDAQEFLLVSLSTLRPWRRIINDDKIQDLTSKYVMTRLAKHMSNLDISRNSKKQNWATLDCVCELFDLSLMTSREFLSVMEGELLVNWAATLHSWLISGDVVKPESLAAFYFAWRDRLLQPSVVDSKAAPSCRLLRSDERVCRVLYSALVMIQSALGGTTMRLDDLRPLGPGFQGVLARRTREDLDHNEEELQKLQSSGLEYRKHVISRRNGDTATFREVVEDCARELDVEFCPRMGANSIRDGKQVFLFGELPIYFDSNVVFALQKTNWQPVSLDQLAVMAKSQ
jgi:tuftelin-interacting protein 11